MGRRPMVGLQTLALVIRVRILALQIIMITTLGCMSQKTYYRQYGLTEMIPYKNIIAIDTIQCGEGRLKKVLIKGNRK